MTNDKGEVLLVRKSGTRAFMQPGGKIDPGESAREALVRELAEELAVQIEASELAYLGEAEAAAANEPGERVSAAVFAFEYEGEITPQAEIAEASWVHPDSPDPLTLAPLTSEFILPWQRTKSRVFE